MIKIKCKCGRISRDLIDRVTLECAGCGLDHDLDDGVWSSMQRVPSEIVEDNKIKPLTETCGTKVLFQRVNEIIEVINNLDNK